MIKKYTLLLVCVMAIGTSYAQIKPTPIAQPEAPQQERNADVAGPYLEFESMTLDYGTIQQHSEPLRLLSFTNTGTEPLVITNAKGSCGCTVPVWPREPIMPGESSQIEIRYATNRVGPFTKTVKFSTNEVANAPQHVIKVTGKVLKEEEEQSVPGTEPSMLSPGGGK